MVDGNQVMAGLQSLRAAQRDLVKRPRAEITAVIDRVVAEWLDPASVWRRRAAADVPAESGFSPEMFEHALPTMLQPLRAPQLEQLLLREGGTTLDSDAVPALTAHILPSNLPAMAAIPSALALACRSSTLIKPGRNDRAFSELWRESLIAADPALGRCVEICYWRGGDQSSQSAVLDEADVVVAAGSDTAVANLRSATHHRFVGYGHKLSFAFAARECLADRDQRRATAHALARDVALWDQRGCLSPRVCFAEGGFEAARELGAVVLEELRHIAATLPPGRLSTGEQLDIRRYRDAAEWRAIADDLERIFFADQLHVGSVVVEQRTSLFPAPAHRCISIIPVAADADMIDLLHPLRALLEGAGIAAPAERRESIRQALAAESIPYVATLGEMQYPPLNWRQGGISRLAPWTEAE